jgi:hypothetical protein
VEAFNSGVNGLILLFRYMALSLEALSQVVFTHIEY